MTIAEFVVWFQKNVTDKPLIDRTGLTGHYDFALTWTPGESEFPQFRRTGGFNPSPASTDNPKSFPGLYKAFQEQLGLKLTAIKAPVDVMVIDHAESPPPTDRLRGQRRTLYYFDAAPLNQSRANVLLSKP